MTSTTVHVLAVAGSLGRQSVTRVVLRQAAAELAQAGCHVDFLDFSEDPLPLFDPDSAYQAPCYPALRARVEAADVLLLGTPDYHGSMSSALKNFLDHFWKEFAGKLFVPMVASHEKGLTVADQIRTVARQCYAWGKHGRGTGEHFGMEDKVDLVLGTFSKSFASIGGFVAGDAYVLDYIKHHSRTLIFSASMPPAATAAVIAAVDILEKEPERIEHLWRNVHKMKRAFDELGFNTGHTQSPIIPIHVGEDMKTFEFWKSLYENGIFTNPVITPAVPAGQGLIRTSYMATHTDEILDQIIDTFARIGRRFGLI